MTAQPTNQTTEQSRDEPIEVPRGLKNVVVTTTELGDVRGGEGFYHYRQYSAIELANHRSLEDVWFLFTDGHLPTPTESEKFAAEIAPQRQLPPTVAAALPTIATAGQSTGKSTGQPDRPLFGLRTALSLAASEIGAKPLWDSDPDQRRADALRVCALTPTILAALHQIRHGHQPLEPRPELGTAANWLYLVSGEIPSETHANAIEKYLVATVDHGFNASTFTGRVVASTGADVISAVAAAIGAFSGPLHGGAPDRALEALDEIGTPEAIRPWVRRRITDGERIMGFGHPVYRTYDPRAAMLRETAVRLADRSGTAKDIELVEFARATEREVVAALAELKPGRALHTNVEFYAGVVMELCGLPRSLFTPTFAVSRVIGWCANILEQATDTKIIRPVARYVGPPPADVVPTTNRTRTGANT